MRLYRALLRLYPASFRAEYADEMCAIFADRRRDAGGRATPALWASAVADVVSNASRLHLDILRQDLRYTLRTLSRAPAFTATVILVSAVGIGATTAAFSIADHVLIRPLPYPEPDRLVKIWQDATARGYPRTELSPGNYRDWKEASRSFEAMGAYTAMSMNVVGPSAPERLDGFSVTPELFTLLGARAALGRTFAPTDDDPSAPRFVILSDGVWRALFGADPRIVGRSVLLDDLSYEVIGVMPPGFYFPTRSAEFWTALSFGPQDYADRGNLYLYAIGRLREGVTVEQAAAELRVIAQSLERADPVQNAQLGAAVHLLKDQVSTRSRQMLLALAGAALCVLLIACTNLANLLLARALSRQKELALRAAVGAGAERLFRQMLTESLVLAFFGGIAAVFVAWSAAPLIARLVPTTLPISEAAPLDLRMLALSGAFTLFAGLAFGILPAMRVRRTDLAGLRTGERTGTSRGTHRLRGALVAAQIAACVVLLICSGLLMRALWRVQQTDPGFDTAGVLTLRTWLPVPKYGPVEARERFYRQVLSSVRALPGVSHAGYISFLPMTMRGGIWPVMVEGAGTTMANAPRVSLRYVTPGFFGALGIRVLRGRDVADSDTSASPYVGLVSESFARKQWPGQDPIGRRFEVAFSTRTVIGVVTDIRVRGLEAISEPQVYLASSQVPDSFLIWFTPKDLVVKAAVPGASLVPAIREIVARADSQQPISDVQMLADVVAADTGPRRTQARALTAFAAVALIVAALGIHGLLAFTVSAQLREIGVRIALGARSSAIVGMVLRRTLILTGIGVVIGTGAAYAAGRGLQTLLAGVSPADVPTFAAAVGLSIITALAGSLLPALQAVRADPLSAMRAE
jgi:predicted permease